jgi:UDP-glucose 4-epimerase
VPVVQHDNPRVGDIRESLGDPNRARTVLGVTADVTLEDGLAALLRRA